MNNQHPRSLVNHLLPLRELLSLESKSVLPGLQKLEKDTCLSYKRVTLPTESSHVCAITEMQIHSDKSKWIPVPPQKELFIPVKCWLSHGPLCYCWLCMLNMHSPSYFCNELGKKCDTRHNLFVWVFLCFHASMLAIARARGIMFSCCPSVRPPSCWNWNSFKFGTQMWTWTRRWTD